jgi:hypothetical protein
VIARILPVLASIKLDNMKWVFATGLGRFCEAILNYSANKQNEPRTESKYTMKGMNGTRGEMSGTRGK